MNYLTYKMDDYVKVGDDGRKVLGVDIQPEKACIFDCIVCNRGRTKYQGEWHDFGDITESLEDLRRKVAETAPDLVEIYGQGDILINVHLKDIIDCVHALGVPVRLVTNCYLLGIGEHMKVASLAEEVVGAFGIVDDEAFRIYHRPLPELDFTPAKQAESLIRFSQQYQGKLTLRVFLSQGYNDSDESAAKLKAIIDQVRYDSLWVVSTNKLAVPEERVAQIQKILQG